MSFFNRKSIKVWVGVNKNGKLSMHAEQPIRDDARGIWVSKLPFINSVLYLQIKDMFEKAKISWVNDCEFLEFQLG